MGTERHAPGSDLKDQIEVYRGLRGEKCPYVRSPNPNPDFRSFDQAQLSYYLYVRESLIYSEPVKSDKGYSWLLVVELINDRRDPQETMRLLTKLYCACNNNVEGYAFLPVPSVLFEYAVSNNLDLPRVAGAGVWAEALRSELLSPTPDDLNYRAVGLLIGRPSMVHHYFPEEAEAARLFNAALPAVDDKLRRLGKGGIIGAYGTGEQTVGLELFGSLPYFYDRGCTLTYTGSDDRLTDFLGAMYAYCHRLLEGNAGRNARPVPRVFDKDLRKVVDKVYNDGAIMARPSCTKASRGTVRRFSDGMDVPMLVHQKDISRYVLSSMLHHDLGMYRDKGPGGPCPYIPSGSDNPDFRHMSKGAIQYYLQWRNRTRDGRYGQADDGYLWLYECELINDDRGSGYVLDRLAGLARAYDRFFRGSMLSSSIMPGKVYHDYAFLECPRIPDPTVYPCDIGACDMIGAILDGTDVPVSPEVFLIAMGVGDYTLADQNLRASFSDDCARLAARILARLNCTEERVGIVKGYCGLDVYRVQREVFVGLRYYGMPGKGKRYHVRDFLGVVDNRIFRREMRGLARAIEGP